MHLSRPSLRNNTLALQPGLLCSLSVQYLQPSPFFATTAAASSVQRNNGSSAKTPVKMPTPAEPRPAAARRHVAKHVTVDQSFEKFGRCGLCNNKGLFVFKYCGAKVAWIPGIYH